MRKIVVSTYGITAPDGYVELTEEEWRKTGKTPQLVACAQDEEGHEWLWHPIGRDGLVDFEVSTDDLGIDMEKKELIDL